MQIMLKTVALPTKAERLAAIKAAATTNPEVQIAKFLAKIRREAMGSNPNSMGRSVSIPFIVNQWPSINFNLSQYSTLLH